MVTSRAEEQKLDVRSNERSLDRLFFIFLYEPETVEGIWVLEVILGTESQLWAF